MADGSEVFAQVKELGVAFEVTDEHQCGNPHKAEQQPRVKVDLLLDVRRVVETFAFAKDVRLLKRAQQKVVLARQTEHKVLVFVVIQTHRPFAEGGLGCARQI